ncbi:diguanylate cyclase domain-containing protein [Thiohalocapsa halophila]
MRQRRRWSQAANLLLRAVADIINDSLGHRAGDRLLVAVAERLAADLEATDTVTRFGGDELVVVLERGAAEPAAIAAAASRLLDALAQPFRIGPREYSVTASAGLVITTGTEDVDEVLRDADAAMYRAKARGGGQVQQFDAPMRAELLKRVELGRALRGSGRRAWRSG